MRIIALLCVAALLASCGRPAREWNAAKVLENHNEATNIAMASPALKKEEIVEALNGDTDHFLYDLQLSSYGYKCRRMNKGKFVVYNALVRDFRHQIGFTHEGVWTNTKDPRLAPPELIDTLRRIEIEARKASC